MATTVPSPGIYRIVVAGLGGAFDGNLLTRHESHVTILPPSVHPDQNQEWGIIPGQAPGNIIITRPSPIIPTSYLTYKGAPEKPKEGDRIEQSPIREFPPNKWHAVIAPGFRYLLRVAGSELGIRLGEELIHPPFLKLGFEDQFEWRFERIRDE